MKTVRREASRHSKQNKRKYTKGEINELETNNKNKKVTEFQVMNVAMNGHRPRTTIINGKNGNTLEESYCVLNRRWKYFYK